jgi:hypothetical protein
MAEGAVKLTRSEERDVVALLLTQAEARLLEASHQFQDIVFEMEWRLRDYLQLKPSARKAKAAAERVIHARNADGHRLHLEIIDLEGRIADFAKWLGIQPERAKLSPSLITLLFRHLYAESDAGVSNWQTLAAATLSVFTDKRAGFSPLVSPQTSFNDLIFCQRKTKQKAER